MNDELNEKKDAPLDLSAAGQGGTVPPIPPKDAVRDIEQRLAGERDTETESRPLDVLLKGITPDELQRLKMILAATPDRPTAKKGNPIILLRRYQGNFIVNIGNAYNTLQRNSDTGFTNEVLMLPIRLLGSEKDELIPWKEFMQAEQVKCEVLKREQRQIPVTEGEPIPNRDTGTLVERVVMILEETLTVKLPEGSPQATVELPVKIANA
jgi:hypothetical protein